MKKTAAKKPVTHLSSDGARQPGVPRKSCGCQSCRHTFGPSAEQKLIAAGRLDRLATLQQALETLLPEGDQITEQPTPGAKWNTGALPRIGDIIHCHVHYPANGRGVDVKPGTPGVVVGYFAEGGWQYCVTQFPGKAVLVAAVDVIVVKAPALTPAPVLEYATTDNKVQYHPRNGSPYVTVRLNKEQSGAGMLWLQVMGDEAQLPAVATEVVKRLNCTVDARKAVEAYYGPCKGTP